MSRAKTNRASRVRLSVGLVAGAVLALGVLGAATARTGAPPEYGGTLVVGQNGDGGALDPTVNTSTTGSRIFSVICEQLYDRDSRQNLVPVLAASLPVLSKDKLSYTI